MSHPPRTRTYTSAGSSTDRQAHQDPASPLLSACLIVRDEAEHLSRCLESLRPLADEVVVVDTGSTDDTVRIARDLGASVYEDSWRDDFSFHRNQAIERAHGRWLLTIDADEELIDTDVAETRQRLEADGLPDILLVRHRCSTTAPPRPGRCWMSCRRVWIEDRPDQM